MQFNLTKYWYRKNLHLITILLLPLSWLFGFFAATRRLLYRCRIIKTHHFTPPIIVVGNITVGGTGKTPVVIWLAQFLKAQGYQPGIVSRGVGGKQQKKPHWVNLNDAVEKVGDEALLILQRTACPLVISIDRVAAVKHLLERSRCDIVISDDGLQHYRLGRVVEIAVIDGARYFGNRCLLPAGPLREPIKRLRKVDFTIVNNAAAHDDNKNEFTLTFEQTELVSLKLLLPNGQLTNGQSKISLTDFPHKKVHAVAGIGNPERFFLSLRAAGFEVITHPFPDHHLYHAEDFEFNDALPILMTEKDAVKCRSFADQRYWCVTITAKISNGFEQKLLAKLKQEVGDEVKKDFVDDAGPVFDRIKSDPICK